ncbi:MAG: tRNA lysidine(34) synthetase TilS [Dehalogenimonas sp.]|uniref:tRNA(Ile)-lysidine synthase n=1 Tax=Candidatus Dehalogenimonas loeffleri TaxID=3127115 RepID=A0ABZ2J4X1_9CHLR|nr:tRNA lysidine(34) synthetase TilS [Dehalogenimonas sp.]
MRQLEKWVLDFITGHRLVSRGERVVAAVSGGADSVCLLSILHKYQTELGITLAVAHLDHGLRGAESDADAEFVRALAARLDLPAVITRRDVTAYQAEYRLTPEEAAREVRYQFLSEVAESGGATSVAVAHTKSDHVETVMLHLLRGSGLSGLVGLKEAVTLRYKRIECLQIIRPLICLTRAEVETYCRLAGLEFRTDSTNESLTPTRNRIRRQLLPEIRRDFNPRIDEALDRLSQLAADEQDFISGEAGCAAEKLIIRQSGLAVIDQRGLAALHPALRRSVLKQALAEALGSPKDIEAGHIEDMMDIAAGNAGRAIDLPAGLVFAAGYGELYLGRDLAGLNPLPPLEGEYRLNIPGVTEFSGRRVTAEIIDNTGDRPAAEGMVMLMDYDKAGGDLTVRARRPGDRFQPQGMSQEKKLKDYFIDARVPRPWRDRVPVVVSPGQIVGLAGYRLDDRVKVTAATVRVLRLDFTYI